MIRIVLLALAALCYCVPPAHAEAEVSHRLVCAAKSAIAWKVQPWSPEKCAAVAGALNSTAMPMTFLAIAVNESDLTDRAIAWHGRDIADVGLLGIRCVLGPDRRCTNGPAAGYTVAQLRDAVTNIAVGSVLMTIKGRVSRWNAGSRGYAGRIAVLVAALGGVEKKTSSKRVRALARKIAAAARGLEVQ